MDKLTLDEIMAKTLWVAKMYGYRCCGTYDEVANLGHSEECRDFDISANQPEELNDFYNGYFEYERTSGFITIPDYYNNIYAKGVA